MDYSCSNRSLRIPPTKKSSSIANPNRKKSLPIISIKKKSSRNDFIPVRANVAARLCNDYSPVTLVNKPQFFACSENSMPEYRSDIDAAKIDRSIQKRYSTTDSAGSNKKNKKLRRGRAVRRFLFIKKRQELGVERLLRRSKKKFYTLLLLLVLKISLASYFVYLIMIDFQNANFRVADVSRIRQANFDVGAYPMSGMLLMASSVCLDGASVLIFLFGLMCQCGYFRYYMRFVFIDFLMTFTGVCTLFISERKAISYLKEFFKIILEYEYGDDEAKIGTDFVDKIQQMARCCGYSKPSDWKKSRWWDQENRIDTEILPFPYSCCDHSENYRLIGNQSIACFDFGCEQNIFSTVAYARVICQYLAIGKVLLLLFCMLLCALMYRDFVISIEKRSIVIARRSMRSAGSRRRNSEDRRRRRMDRQEVERGGEESIGNGIRADQSIIDRHLFEIEERPSENQPSTNTDEENIGNTKEFLRHGADGP